MNTLRQCILVVDDEALIADAWCIHMEMIGVEVCGTAATADSAVALAIEHRPAVVLMDVRLKGQGDGIDAANAIREHVPSKIIFITGSREPETIARIQLSDPAGLLFKPVADHQLHTAVREALRLAGEAPAVL